MFGQTVIVMGGSGGIGEAICTVFARAGANVVACGRRKQVLESLIERLPVRKTDGDYNPEKEKKKEIHSTARNFVESEARTGISPSKSSSQQQHSLQICNVSDIDSVTDAFSSIQKQYRQVNHLVNAFGITADSILLKQGQPEIQKVLDTNLLGTINSCKVVSRLFLKQRHGSIVNISSIVGQHGNRGQTVYAASKAGVIGFSKALAKELGQKNVRVNVICPGFIETNMTKKLSEPDPNTKENSPEYSHILKEIILKRFGQPKDVADGVLFLTRSNYITGSVLNIDGGLYI